MYCLSDKQIDYILNDIRARGVEMEDLQLNLLDHVCCIVEHKLEENGDFESFYQNTISTFYKRDLWEIEEETISLIIFKNYYTMKKTMLYSGVISAVLVSAGITFKFMHWAGASALLVLGIVLSSLVFLPLMYILKIKEKQSTRDKVITGLGSLAAIALSLGILFKIQHWPMANVLGMSSLLILLCVFLPIYFFTGIRNHDTKVNTVVSSALLVIGCGLFMALIRSPRASYVLKVRDTQFYVLSQEILSNERELASHMKADSVSNFELTSRVDALCEDLKARILDLEVGVKSLDRNFENKNLLIEEGSFGYNPYDESSGVDKTYKDLLSSIDAYNLWVGKHSGLAAIPVEKNFVEYLNKGNNNAVTCMTLLGQLTQMQMILFQNKEKLAIR